MNIRAIEQANSARVRKERQVHRTNQAPEFEEEICPKCGSLMAFGAEGVDDYFCPDCDAPTKAEQTIARAKDALRRIQEYPRKFNVRHNLLGDALSRYEEEHLEELTQYLEDFADLLLQEWVNQ